MGDRPGAGIRTVGSAAAGRCPTWRAALVAAGVAVGALALFAAIDLARRPGSRTHLGRFASDLLGGRADERCAASGESRPRPPTRNAATLLVVPVAAGFSVGVGAGRPIGRHRGARRALRRLPLLRATLGLCRGSGLGIGRQRQRCSRSGGDHVSGGARRGPGGDGSGSASPDDRLAASGRPSPVGPARSVRARSVRPPLLAGPQTVISARLIVICGTASPDVSGFVGRHVGVSHHSQ